MVNDRLEKVEEGLKYLIDLDLFDDFYNDIWIGKANRLLGKYEDRETYRDLPLEETDDAKQHVIEWFGEDCGLAVINDAFWKVAVGSVEEGGNKWWYKVRLNTDSRETARKIILLSKLLKEE